MKKKNLKSLTLNKKHVSKLDNNIILGGKDYKTFLAEGCGLSVHRPMCDTVDENACVARD